jgi:hypothetical protein
MSVDEIIHAVQALSRAEKFQLAHLLLEVLSARGIADSLQGRTGLSDLHA